MKRVFFQEKWNVLDLSLLKYIFFCKEKEATYPCQNTAMTSLAYLFIGRKAFDCGKIILYNLILYFIRYRITLRIFYLATKTKNEVI